MNKNPMQQVVKVQITLTSENLAWMDKRIADWKKETGLELSRADVVGGCVTMRRSQEEQGGKGAK
jgi:hypothetical protein